MINNSTMMGSSTTNAASRTMKGFMLLPRAKQPANRQPGVRETGENEETCDQHWPSLF
jgi:hypothetical protein